MVKVGNQGLDDRHIRLLSHRPLYPGVGIASVSFDRVFETRFSNVRRLDILKFSFHHFWTKFPFNRVSNQNWFLGHDHARLTRLVLFSLTGYKETSAFVLELPRTVKWEFTIMQINWSWFHAEFTMLNRWKTQKEDLETKKQYKRAKLYKTHSLMFWVSVRCLCCLYYKCYTHIFVVMCCKSKSCCHLDSWFCWWRTRK